MLLDRELYLSFGARRRGACILYEIKYGPSQCRGGGCWSEPLSSVCPAAVLPEMKSANYAAGGKRVSGRMYCGSHERQSEWPGLTGDH